MNLADHYRPAPKPQSQKKKNKQKNKQKSNQKNNKKKYGKKVPRCREKELYDRDGGYCVHCLLTKGKYVFTNAEGKGGHHIIFRSHANPYHVHDLSNLITLCEDCHTYLHGKYGNELRLWCVEWSIEKYGLEKVERTRSLSKGVGVLQ